MRRYLRVYSSFVASSFARETEFRANFVAKFLRNAMWLGFFLLVVLVIFSNTKVLAGWSEPETLVLVATVFLMSSVAGATFFSLQEFPTLVRQGTLDFVLTKPVDSQFYASMRKVNFDEVGTIVAGVAVLFVGLRLAHLHPSLGQWASWAALMACALAIFYGFSLALMTSAIWLVRIDNLWVLTDSAIGVARNPADVYPTFVQRLMLYVLPLSFFATVPAKMLTRGADLRMVALGAAWAAAALLASRGFWLFAMRSYGSASS